MSPLRPLLPPLLAMACLLVGAPLRAAPSPAALEAALNDPAPTSLAAVFEPGPDFAPAELEARRSALRDRFPDLRWQVASGAPLGDGRPTLEITARGSRQEGPTRYRLVATELVALQSHGERFNGQDVIRESSLVRSGSKDLAVTLLVPDAVLTGQRYDLDVVVDEPLDGAVLAGAVAAVTPRQLAQSAMPELQLEALGGGGIFKTVQAPSNPGSQTWSVLLVHPDGIVTATKRVRVVADKAALTP
jgi:hypothetical protein